MYINGVNALKSVNAIVVYSAVWSFFKNIIADRTGTGSAVFEALQV